MTESPIFTIVDEPAIDPDSFVVGDDGETCTFEGCTEPRRIYGGRGPRPKTCETHKSAPRSNDAVRGPKEAAWKARLTAALQGQLTMVAVTTMAFNRYDGMCIMNGSENLARSLVQVAEQNPKVRKALENMVTAGAWAGVATAVAGIAIPILANHNVLPSDLLGERVGGQAA
jgi:hypothetical protein